MLIKDFTIGEKRLRIIDGLLKPEHVAQLANALTLSSYRRMEIATPKSSHIKHHSLEITPEQLKQLNLHNVSVEALAGFSPGQTYKIFRQYCNVCFYGDLLLPHRDANPDQTDITALWYLNAQWEREWGGETLFFDEEARISHAIEMVPGRLVLFDGCILHVGKTPNRQCYEGRLTLAIKFYADPG